MQIPDIDHYLTRDLSVVGKAMTDAENAFYGETQPTKEIVDGLAVYGKMTQRTHAVFGPRPRVHTVIHGDYRLSMYMGPCQNELFNLKADIHIGEKVGINNIADVGTSKIKDEVKALSLKLLERLGG